MLKNRFTRILALVAVFVVVFYSVIAVIGVTTPLQNILGVTATPFRWMFSGMANAIGGFGEYFTEFRSLREENDELARRVAELEAELAHTKELEGENAWMREFLGVSDALEEFELMTGTVIGKETNSYMTLYTLNKGSLQGVERDMAVVSNGSIVGRVESVGLNFCKVSTILENASSVSALCARSGLAVSLTARLGFAEAELAP